MEGKRRNRGRERSGDDDDVEFYTRTNIICMPLYVAPCQSLIWQKRLAGVGNGIPKDHEKYMRPTIVRVAWATTDQEIRVVFVLNYKCVERETAGRRR